MKKRTREEYHALNDEYCEITKKIEISIGELTEYYRNFFNDKDIDKLNALYGDILSINDQFMYGKDPVINEEMHATYISNTEKLSEKICAIYKAACDCNINDYNILMHLYEDISLLEIADKVEPNALSTPDGPIRKLLDEYMAMYCEIVPFYDDVRIARELERLEMQIGVCIDVMRHRSDFALYNNECEDAKLYGWRPSSVSFDFN